MEGTIARVVRTYWAFASASRMSTTSAIVFRWAGTFFQHPSIIFHTGSESSPWSGRAGLRPFDIE